MTREKAIVLLECSVNELTGTLAEKTNTSAAEQLQRYIDAYDMAISALRQQETVTNRHGLNEPLTLDDLRKMYDGEEGPVWIKIGLSCLPAILDTYDGELVAVWSAAIDFCHEKDYGKNWLAYRQKPEDGTV